LTHPGSYLKLKRGDRGSAKEQDAALRSPHVKSLAIVLAAAIGGAAVHTNSLADTSSDSRTHWATLRVQGTAIVPLGDNSVEAWNDCGSGWIGYLNFSSSIDVNSSAGVLASFEYVAARRFGFEIDLVYWSEAVGLRFKARGLTVEGSPNFILPTLGANYHFLTSGKIDAFAGGLCTLGVIATGFGANIDVSKDFALGLNLGMDYYIGASWSIGGSVKYLDFGDIDFSVLPPGIGLVCDNGLFGIGDMNFISLTFGVGYRF
jgi:outer membrane protein W